ncbi:FG-GAP repeat domain-containing protein [Nocardia sp. NPDC060256]|uniref:FG-GAP repeat domain-containing protein n=1 Tax=unclassified Nocardia TaxID=2637762 RepID=UPI00366782F3
MSRLQRSAAVCAALTLTFGSALGSLPGALAQPPSGSGSGSAGPDPVFEESVQYPVGGLGAGVGSQTIAVGDFFGDGVQSVAATGIGGGVGILHGDGRGQLTRPQWIGTEVGANAIQAADLRGIGVLDLVVTNYLSITVLFNDGHGNFTVDRTYATDFNPDVTYRTGGIPFGVAIADFDHTGRQSIAINSFIPVPGGVGIMDNDGAGHFAPPRWFGAGIGKASLLTGDVDNDGWPDLVSHDLATSGVWVLVNDRHGGFLPPRWNLATLPSEDIKLADMDGDGNLDIITANIAAFGFSVHYGDGHGNFGAPTPTIGGIAPCAIAIGDFTGSGRMDVVALQYLPSTAMVFRNNGDRTFGYVEQHTVGLGPQAAQTAQLRPGHRPDVLTMSTVSQDVAVLLNRIPEDDAR